MKRLFLLLMWLTALPIGMLAQGTTWQSATEIQSGELKSGSLADKKDDAWYKIIVPEEGTVKFTVNPGGTLSLYYVKLYWVENGEVKERNSSGGGQEEIVFTITDVGIGTYYLQIHRYSRHGGYKLKYQFTPCPLANDAEPNNEWNNGALLTSGKTVEGRLGYRDADNFTDDDDWYRIDVNKDGKAEFTINPNQENELSIYYVKLYWVENGEVRERNSSGGGQKEIVFPNTDLGIGTYYLQIHRYSRHGGYELKYQFTPNPYKGDEEPNDTYENAQALYKGLTMTGHLGYRDGDNYRDEDDWYKIDVKNIGDVDLTVSPNQDFELSIYYMKLFRLNDNGDLKEIKNIGVGKEQGTMNVEDLPAGTYYVQVHLYNGHGGYTLTYGHASAVNVATIVNFLTGNTAGFSENELDINGDGAVNIIDIILMINILLGN